MLGSNRFLLVLAILAGILVLVAPALADSWSLAGDFSSTTQGNRGWYYMNEWNQQLGAATMYSGAMPDYNMDTVPAVIMWGGWPGGLCYTTATTTLYKYPMSWSPIATIPAGVVGLNPGNNNGQSTAARWVAPAGGGDYTYTVTFTAPAGTLAKNGVYVNSSLGRLGPEQYLSDAVTSYAYTGTKHLNAGQYFDFVQDTQNSSNSNTFWDNYECPLVLVDASIISAVASNTGTVSGTVTSSVSGVVAGAVIQDTVGAVFGPSTTTASDGTYSMPWLYPGSHTLTATKNGFVTATITVTVTAGSTPNGNIVMTPQTGTVTGTITDGTNPLQNVLVQDVASGVNTTTAANGTYSLNPVPVGTRTIQASLAGYSTESNSTVSVTAGVTTPNVNFTLAASYISGTVTDAATHAAISGATVAGIPGGYSTTTSGSGTYTLKVSPGVYTVTATQASHVPGSVTGVVVAKSANVTGQNIQMQAGADFATMFAGVNPNGAWNYRYTDSAGAEHQMGFLNFRDYSPPAYLSWTGDAPSGMPWYFGPMFLQNTSGNPTATSIEDGAWNYDTVYREVGKVVAMSGFGDNLSSIVHYTVPNGGVYSVTARFAGADLAGSNVPVAVRQNGAYIFGRFQGTAANGYTDAYGTTQTVSGFAGRAVSGYTDSSGAAPVVTFSKNLSLAQGDTVDALVLYPRGSSAWSNLVQLDMDIAPAISGIGTVAGVVRSDLPGNPPVAGATVSIQGGDVPFDTTTASDGSYSITVISGVSYDILVQDSGCTDDTSVTGLLVNEGVTYTRNFTLHHSGTWNLSSDYSNAFNPNGQWSFRDPSGVPYARGHFNYFMGGRTVWGSGSPVDLNFQAGWVDKVMTGGPVTWNVYSLDRGYVDNGQVMLGGGQGQSMIRWTSPYNVQKIMNVNLTITSLDPQGAELSCQVKKNGSILATKTAQGFIGRAINGLTDSIGPSPKNIYVTDLIVNSGDSLDFGSAYRHDQNNYWGGFPANEAIGIALIISPGSGTLCTSVAQVKSQPVGNATVFLTTPTAAICDLNADHGFNDESFWVEDNDRSGGMKCIGNAALVQVNVSGGPKLVTLSGKITLDPNGSGQKVLSVDTITSVTDGTATPNPIGTGGKSFASTTKPTNVLARVWGKITEKVANPDSATNTNWPWLYWTINDGGQSVRISMIGQQGQMNTQNLIDMSVDHYIGVTGISTLDSSGNVVILPWNEFCLNDYIGR